MILILVDYQLALTTPLPCVELACISLLCFIFNSLPVLQISAEFSFIGVFQDWIYEQPLTLKSSSNKTSLVRGAIIPDKLAQTMFLPQQIHPLVNPFVIMLLPHSMRLLVQPSTLIFQICNLVRVDSLILSSPYEIACIVENKKTLFEVGLEVLGYFSLKISQKITIFLGFVDLYIAFGQVILQMSISISVDDIVGRFEFPHFIS